MPTNPIVLSLTTDGPPTRGGGVVNPRHDQSVANKILQQVGSSRSSPRGIGHYLYTTGNNIEVNTMLAACIYFISEVAEEGLYVDADGDDDETINRGVLCRRIIETLAMYGYV